MYFVTRTMNSQAIEIDGSKTALSIQIFKYKRNALGISTAVFAKLRWLSMSITFHFTKQVVR